MPSTTEITVARLSRLVGLPNAPRPVDVRTDADDATAETHNCPSTKTPA